MLYYLVSVSIVSVKVGEYKMEQMAATAKKHTKVTADAVIVSKDKLLLVKRGIEPFMGKWALPGGHLEYGESIEDCVVRETKEETGLDIEPLKLVGVYSKAGRDPRGHTLTVAYLCRPLDERQRPRAADDAAEARWFRLDAVPELAFDHRKIIEDARAML